MTFTHTDLHFLEQLAISAAYQAGRYIAQNTGKYDSIQNKSDAGTATNHASAGTSIASQVVTEIDIAAQAKIISVLEPTLNQYNIALLAEETADDKGRLEKPHFWCIDPLDGTLPFIEGKPGYAVSIALVNKQGKAIIGVIYDPYNDILYNARQDTASKLNGNEYQVPESKPENSTLYFYHDRSFLSDPVFPEVITQLEEYASDKGFNDMEIQQIAGAALNGVYSSLQHNACYFKFPKNEKGGGSLWDFSAASVIAQSAGAVVSDIWGQALNLNRPDSTFLNNSGVIFASRSEIQSFIIELYQRLQNEAD